ncbi:HAD-IA family hydrolase [Lysobacter sp. F60174L2]|uniref:HAD-IA family hydrolase n=1 Tax=Lysobacter sp. F60174L2 TaxID=3459295 RepID=UPI00403D8C3F
MKTRAVLFDVYGTLIELQRQTGAYKDLIRRGSVSPAAFAREVMCSPIDLAEAAELFNVQMSQSELTTLEQHLREEIASARLYPEVLSVLTTLRIRGYRIGLCSNLAIPYIGPAIRLIGSAVDSAIWSCEVCVMKPSPRIYELAAEALEVDPTTMLMVGDSYRADVAGARRAGCKALHLDRRRRSRGDLTSLSELLPRLPPLP